MLTFNDRPAFKFVLKKKNKNSNPFPFPVPAGTVPGTEPRGPCGYACCTDGGRPAAETEDKSFAITLLAFN